MNTSMMKGVAAGGIAMVVLGAGAVGGYRTLATPPSAIPVSIDVFMAAIVRWPRRRAGDESCRMESCDGAANSVA